MVDQTKRNNTRFDIYQDPRNPQDHLQSGYEGSSPTDYTIPSCDIEDVDTAMHNLFNHRIGFKNVSLMIPEENPDILTELAKPHVVFASGERFALVKKLRPLRDKNKQLMLPAICIRRKSIAQTSTDITSRGMNQFTGDIVIRRKLAPEDRDYQALLNKLLIPNNSPNGPTSTRPQGSNGPLSDPGTADGALLDPKLGNNVWEIITIPQPQFYTATYEITFWTTHTLHMNYLIMTLLSAQLPQGKAFRLNTEKGYWFIAEVAEDITSSDNFEEYKEEKRLVRYTFQMTVKAFLLGYNGPGVPVPIRRHLSATDVSFELIKTNGRVLTTKGNPHAPQDPGFTLTDFEEDPETAETPTTNQRLKVEKTFVDPITGKTSTRRLYIRESNQKSGETSYYSSDFETLDEVITAITTKTESNS